MKFPQSNTIKYLGLLALIWADYRFSLDTFIVIYRIKLKYQNIPIFSIHLTYLYAKHNILFVISLCFYYALLYFELSLLKSLKIYEGYACCLFYLSFKHIFLILKLLILFSCFVQVNTSSLRLSILRRYDNC